MGKQNNIVKFGVPGFFGCSGVPGYSGVFRSVPECFGVPGRFPFGQKFRKFRFGAKWKTFFRFARLENSQKKWNCSKGSPVFPVGTSQWKFVPFTEFLVFIIGSMPFAVF